MRALVLWTLLVCCAAWRAPAQWTLARHVVDGGLPQNSIRGLAFDRAGQLWLTTEGGLVRYDGRNMQAYSSLSDSVILDDRLGDMLADLDGALYFIDASRSLYRVGPDGPLRLVDGRVFGSQRGRSYGLLPSVEAYTLIHHDKDAKRPDLVLHDHAVQVMALGKDRWLELTPKAMRSIVDGRVVRTQPLDGDPLHGFALDGEAYVMGKDGRIQRYEPVSGAFLEVPHTGPWPRGGSMRVVWNVPSGEVYVLSDEELWSLRIDAQGIARAERLLGALPEGTRVNVVVRSPDGERLFLGTGTKGLYIYSRERFSTVRNSKAPPNSVANSFYALAPWDDSTVFCPPGWLASSRGFGSTPLNGMRYVDRHFLHMDRKRRTWVGSSSRLQVMDPLTGALLWSDTVVGSPSALEEQGDTVWLAGRKGLAAIVNDKVVLHLHRPTSDYRQVPTAISVGPDGRLWLATGEGVYAWDLVAGMVKPVQGLQRIYARTLHRSGAYMFIGTYGQGVYVAGMGGVARLPLDRAKATLHVHAFVPDANGNLWLPTNSGLYRVREEQIVRFLSDPRAVPFFGQHGPSEGIAVREFNGGCSPAFVRLANGEVVLPTIDGLVWFRPEDVPDPSPMGEVRLAGLSLNGVPQDPSADLRVVGWNGHVELTVAMPYWGEPDDLQWRYRLVGLPGAQGPIRDDGTVVLERLPSGDFELEVEVAGSNGPRTVRLLRIEVVPPLYARWWALLAISVLLTLAVVLLVRLRIRRLERNRRLLEAIVEERTDDLRRTNDALQREVQVKDRLVSILSHDIVSPLRFIAQVAGRSTRGPQGHDTQELRGVLQDIHSSSDKLYVNARNILSWIKHQDGRIAVVREEVDLHKLVGSVLGQFQRADGVRLTNAVTPGTTMRTDPRILSIILQNLVANAVVHAGGEVHVAAHAGPDAWIITVADNGPGTSEKARALFEERIGGEAERHGDHTATDRPGLGHVIVADLLRLLDGGLRLGTPPQGGTEIEVRLPRHPEAAGT